MRDCAGSRSRGAVPIIAHITLVVLGVACARAPHPGSDTPPAQPTTSNADVALPVSLAPTRPSPPMQQAHVFSADGLGTRVTLVAYADDAGVAKQAFERAMAELWRLDALLSEWRPDTEVSRVNAHPGEVVPISAETFQLVQTSLQISTLSAGAFDITFQGLSELWRFGDARDTTPTVPLPSQVAAARQRVDYRRIELDPIARTIKLGHDQQMGLGGIAKGYVVDRMAAVLRTHGLSAFLLQAGGDLLAHGSKPNGETFTAGIQDPRGPNGTFFASLSLQDHAFSTAGDYSRSYVVEGKRYHHILDPSTGYPATRCRSVTVWAPSALEADAIDDAVFVLGPEKGLELVASLPNVGAVIVDDANRVWVSPELRSRLSLLRAPTNGN